MTYEQCFRWCFAQQVELHFFTSVNGRPEVHVLKSDSDGVYELLGKGKNAMAAVADAIASVKKLEVSA